MRFTKFLMQVSVCLLAAKAILAQVPASRFTDATVSSSVSVSAEDVPANKLSAARIQELLAQSRQVLTADSRSDVFLAAYDANSSRMQVVSLNKESFLTQGGEYVLTSDGGANLRVRIVRPNGVNTAVTVTNTSTGKSMFPLMVRYPLERDGNIKPAFYVSAHPALISDDLEQAGQNYVTTMLNKAVQDLAADGVVIPSDIARVAAHLVIVEHTDHKRFLNEERADISREVLSLYALNRGDTYRFSVSSAGAGGMIQMIPKTYAAIRENHLNVSLKSDFVDGMTNHENALKAMLLYINDTWKFLQSQDEVQQALRSGVATKTELLAAGYNSNPYKLPSYLADGGSGWRTLIPGETQMYLAIYQSVDSNVDFGNSVIAQAEPTTSILAPATAFVQDTTASLISWVGNLLPSPSLPGLSGAAVH